MVTKTIDQIVKDGHSILMQEEEKLKTRIGKLIVIWKRISANKFQREEQYREGIAL